MGFMLRELLIYTDVREKRIRPIIVWIYCAITLANLAISVMTTSLTSFQDSNNWVIFIAVINIDGDETSSIGTWLICIADKYWKCK